eukprot:s811_g14.t1
MIEAYNADLIDEYMSQCRDLLEYWPDIMNADPLLIRDGGHEAMLNGMTDLESNATSVPSDCENVLEAFGKIKMISPMEMDVAFVRAAWMDRHDSEKMEEWRTSVLCDQCIADLLLHADESDKKAFSHWSKYQILVQKGRTAEGIRWFDGHEAGYLSSDKLSTRNLQAITCQEACFCDGHWSTLVGLCKNKRALSEYLSAPAFAQELADIEEKYASEVKEKKKKLKIAAGEQHEEEEADSMAKEAEEEEEEDPQQSELKHMLVGEEPHLPVPEKELKGDDTCLWVKSLTFPSLRKNSRVATTVKLIVDPNSEDKLVDLYMDSWLKDFKDEKNLAYKVLSRKSDTTKEPVFFHSGPYSLDEELVDGHAVGCGNLALLAIRKNLPYGKKKKNKKKEEDEAQEDEEVETVEGSGDEAAGALEDMEKDSEGLPDWINSEGEETEAPSETPSAMDLGDGKKPKRTAAAKAKSASAKAKGKAKAKAKAKTRSTKDKKKREAKKKDEEEEEDMDIFGDGDSTQAGSDDGEDQEEEQQPKKNAAKGKAKAKAKSEKSEKPEKPQKKRAEKACEDVCLIS